MHAERTHDLEVWGLENVWSEIWVKNNTSILIDTFHRPPISPLNTFDLIKLSIYLAVDTAVNTILVLGDFNED